jgi:hypothetical protein
LRGQGADAQGRSSAVPWRAPVSGILSFRAIGAASFRTAEFGEFSDRRT